MLHALWHLLFSFGRGRDSCSVCLSWELDLLGNTARDSVQAMRVRFFKKVLIPINETPDEAIKEQVKAKLRGIARDSTV